MKNVLALGIVTLIIGVVATFAVYSMLPSLTLASAPSGLPATVATSSRVTVNATQKVVVASSSCTARIISTASSSIMLTFADQGLFVPSQDVGFFQATNTTAVYDSGQYGCGLVRAYSWTTQQITVSETR